MQSVLYHLYTKYIQYRNIFNQRFINVVYKTIPLIVNYTHAGYITSTILSTITAHDIQLASSR